MTIEKANAIIAYYDDACWDVENGNLEAYKPTETVDGSVYLSETFEDVTAQIKVATGNLEVDTDVTLFKNNDGVMVYDIDDLRYFAEHGRFSDGGRC
jgi:hypothetical protein